MFEDEFNKLADKWDRETRILSNSNTVMRNNNCRKIVEGGKDVVPFILKRMDSERNIHWCFALQEITGENPCKPPEQFGGSGGLHGFNVEEMVQSWIEWGKNEKSESC